METPGLEDGDLHAHLIEIVEGHKRERDSYERIIKLEVALAEERAEHRILKRWCTCKNETACKEATVKKITEKKVPRKRPKKTEEHKEEEPIPVMVGAGAINHHFKPDSK